jgi:hypothetical protein
MANRKLITDRDFQEVLERSTPVRVFEDDHVIEAGGTVIRFDDELVVTQSSVSDISYHRRGRCEFYEMRRR